MRVTFYTLGCKVNQNETGALAQLFEENGYTVVSNEEGADVYIVNSCTVTNAGLPGRGRRDRRGGRCDRLRQPSRDSDRRAEGAER